MRKFRSVIGLLLCAACAMWSCDEVPVGPGNGGNGGDNDSIPSVNDSVPSVDEDTLVVPSVELLPPLEAKQKLESVGIEFVNAVHADAHDNVVDVLDYFARNLGELDLADAYYEKLEGMHEHYHESTDDAEVSRKAPIVAIVKTMMASLEAARSGAKLASTYAETCLHIYRLNLPQAYGGFTPDIANEEWAYDPSVNDRIEFAFTDDNDQKWVATLKGSEKTTRVKIDYSYKSDITDSYEGGDRDGESDNYVYQGGNDIIVDVPENITFTVTCDGVTIIALNVNSSVALDATIKEDVERIDYYAYGEWYDGYWNSWYDESIGEWVEEWVEYMYTGYERYSDERDYDYTFSIDYSNLNVAAELKVNGYEESLTVDVTREGAAMGTEIKIDGRSVLKVSGHVNANVDALIADAENEDFKARNITDIKMNADILGQVQVEAGCKSFKNLYDAFELYDDAQDDNNENLFYNRVKELNSAYSINLSYDGNGVTQANVELEGYEEVDEWNEGETYLNVRPIIVFHADNSRYAIEDYFTETAFSDLIDALEELAEEFDDLYGEFFEEESEELYPDYGEDYGK